METNPISAIFVFLNQGGVTMYVLVFCSILLVGIVLERFYYFWKFTIDHEWLLMQMAYFVENRQVNEALHFCRQIQGGLAKVFEAGILRVGKLREEIEHAMNNTTVEQGLLLDRNLSLVGTVAVVAPFIGLFGTVMGIIQAFQDIALKGATGPAIVSAGVAKALITTAGGLIVAIIAVVFYNYFKGRAKTIVAQMNISSTRFSEMLSVLNTDEPLPEDLRPPVVVERTQVTAARTAGRRT